MKQVTVREFQRQFGKIVKALAVGQSLHITSRGTPVGIFTKGTPKRVKMPDFFANLEKTGGDPKLGDQILKEFYAGLS